MIAISLGIVAVRIHLSAVRIDLFHTILRNLCMVLPLLCIMPLTFILGAQAIPDLPVSLLRFEEQLAG